MVDERKERSCQHGELVKKEELRKERNGRWSLDEDDASICNAFSLLFLRCHFHHRPLFLLSPSFVEIALVQQFSFYFILFEGNRRFVPAIELNCDSVGSTLSLSLCFNFFSLSLLFSFPFLLNFHPSLPFCLEERGAIPSNKKSGGEREMLRQRERER